MRYLAIALAAGVLTSLPEEILAQSIRADGSTDTRVIINPNGSVTVGIASPTRDGVSVNRYDRFSVGRAGATFDNREDGARTIVTEVTGSSRTHINGAIAVDGQSAHLLFANPNGITVNGGSFVNTGQVMLGAGTISGIDREIAPGIYQQNLQLSTSANGSVRIEGRGVSGQMDALHLIAGRIAINGPVSNSNPDILSGVRVVAGQSLTEFDSATVPGNVGQPWATVMARSNQNSGLVYQLGAAGGVNGARIEVLVTDQGAGVRLAGSNVASRGEFVLTSSGNIHFAGGQVRAQTGTIMQAGSFTGDGARVTTRGGSTVMVAQNAAGIDLFDARLSGTALQLASTGGISLQNGSRLAARDGNLVLTAEGAIRDGGGQWQASGWITAETARTLRFAASTVTGGEGAGVILSAEGAFSATDSRLDGDALLSLTAASALFRSELLAGTTIARRGALVIRTTEGDVVNQGTLLQGGQALPDSAGRSGAVTIRSAGGYSASSESSDHQAIVFGLAGNVVIRADEGDILNDSSRILANGDIRLIASGDVFNSIALPNGTSIPTVTDSRHADSIWWTGGLLSSSDRVLRYDYGVAADPDLDALIVASGGNLRVRAGSYQSAGGQALAHRTEDGASGGTVSMQVNDLHVQGVATGIVGVARHCSPFCRYELSGPGVSVTGGVIRGENDLRVSAVGSVLNQGGMLTAGRNVTIQAASARFEGITIPFVVRRPGGLYNFWGSQAGWIYLRDLFGGAIADAGAVTVRTRDAVVLDGATLEAGTHVVTPSGRAVVAAPAVTVLLRDGQIGFFHDLPPVEWE